MSTELETTALLGLASALRIQDLDLDAVFLHQAHALADFGDGAVPIATLASRDLELGLGESLMLAVVNTRAAAAATAAVRRHGVENERIERVSGARWERLSRSG